jgi:hypothetical protein
VAGSPAPPRAPAALVDELARALIDAAGPDAEAFTGRSRTLGVLPARVERGDTVAWRSRTRTRSYGLVEWADAAACHVTVAGGYDKQTSYRYPITWPRVLAHYKGRDVYDRHILGKGRS